MDKWRDITGGFLVGLLVTALACANIGIVPDYHDAKRQCESELPRDKECVMTFVEE